MLMIHILADTVLGSDPICPNGFPFVMAVTGVCVATCTQPALLTFRRYYLGTSYYDCTPGAPTLHDVDFISVASCAVSYQSVSPTLCLICQFKRSESCIDPLDQCDPLTDPLCSVTCPSGLVGRLFPGGALRCLVSCPAFQPFSKQLTAQVRICTDKNDAECLYQFANGTCTPHCVFEAGGVLGTTCHEACVFQANTPNLCRTTGICVGKNMFKAIGDGFECVAACSFYVTGLVEGTPSKICSQCDGPSPGWVADGSDRLCIPACTLIDTSVQYAGVPLCRQSTGCLATQMVSYLSASTSQCLASCAFVNNVDSKICQATCSGGYRLAAEFGSVIDALVCLTCALYDRSQTALGAPRCVDVCPTPRTDKIRVNATHFTCVAAQTEPLCTFVYHVNSDYICSTQCTGNGYQHELVGISDGISYFHEVCDDSCTILDPRLNISRIQRCISICPPEIPYYRNVGINIFSCAASCTFVVTNSSSFLQYCLDNCTGCWQAGTPPECSASNVVDFGDLIYGVPKCMATCTTAVAGKLVKMLNGQLRCTSECPFTAVIQLAGINHYQCSDACQYYSEPEAGVRLCQTECLYYSVITVFNARRCETMCDYYNQMSAADSFECASYCPRFVQNRNGRYECTNTCELPMGYVDYQSMRLCQDCPSRFILAELGFNKCIDVCPVDKFLKNEIIVSTLGSGIFYCTYYCDFVVELSIISGGDAEPICIQQCDMSLSENGIQVKNYTQTTAKLCSPCPNKRRLFGNCVASCPTSAMLLRRFQQTETYDCLSACNFVTQSDSDLICQNTCPGLTAAWKSVQGSILCLSSCDSINPYYDTSQSYLSIPSCVSSCPLSYPVVDTLISGQVEGPFKCVALSSCMYVVSYGPDQLQYMCAQSCSGYYQNETHSVYNYMIVTRCLESCELSVDDSIMLQALGGSRTVNQCVNDCPPTKPLRLTTPQTVLCKQQCSVGSPFIVVIDGANLCSAACYGFAGYKSLQVTSFVSALLCTETCAYVGSAALLGVTQCYDKCPVAEQLMVQQDGFIQCVSSCTFVSTDMWCATSCQVPFGYVWQYFGGLSQKLCSSCAPKTKVVWDASASAFQCLDVCPLDKQLRYQLSDTLYECRGTCIFVDANKFCLDSCVGAKPGTIDVSQVGIFTFTAHQCYSECPVGYYYDKTQVHAGIPLCVQNCPFPYVNTLLECQLDCTVTGMRYLFLGTHKQCQYCKFFTASKLCLPNCDNGFYTLNLLGYECSFDLAAKCKTYVTTPFAFPTGECRDSCYSLFVTDSQQQLCGSTCPTGSFYEEVTFAYLERVCVQSCQATMWASALDNYIGYPKCQTLCQPQQFKEKLTSDTKQTCVNKCASGYFQIIGGEMICMGSNTCQYYQIYINGNISSVECVPSCPTYKVFQGKNLVNLDSYQCVMKCPASVPLIDSVTKICRVYCDSKLYKYIADEPTCQAVCAFSTSSNAFSLTDHRQCVAACPATYPILKQTQCLSLDEASQCAFVDSTQSMCLNSCDTALFYIFDSTPKQCLTTCGHSLFKNGRSCVSQCIGSFSAVIDDENTCAESCSAIDMFVDNIQCVENCGFSIQQYGRCVSSCNLTVVDQVCIEQMESLTIVIKETYTTQLSTLQSALIGSAVLIILITSVAVICLYKQIQKQYPVAQKSDKAINQVETEFQKAIMEQKKIEGIVGYVVGESAVLEL